MDRERPEEAESPVRYRVSCAIDDASVKWKLLHKQL